MTVLGRYLLRQNLLLMTICLGLGTVIYLLSDLFDRLDEFTSEGVPLGTILIYFGSKVPLILSQIMPAVFLIALIVQLGLMSRNRELLALRSGGISFNRFVVFFLVYGVLWSVIQLGFSQYFGVVGETTSRRIWKEDVRGRTFLRDRLDAIWFREGDYLVFMEHVWPKQNRAGDVTVYEMANDSRTLVQVVGAREADAASKGWELSDVTVTKPEAFTTRKAPRMTLPLKQELSAYAVVDPKLDPVMLPIWQLSSIIGQLERSGSNVEALRTAWHGKLSYAFSIVVMALIGLAIATLDKNIYVSIIMGMVGTFIYFGTFTLGSTAGEMGLLTPAAGAWLGNTLFGVAAGLRLVWFAGARS